MGPEVGHRRNSAGFGRHGFKRDQGVDGPDPDVAGLWYATGHGRNGILFAALTAELIRDGLDGTAEPENLSAPSRS